MQQQPPVCSPVRHVVVVQVLHPRNQLLEHEPCVICNPKESMSCCEAVHNVPDVQSTAA